MIHTEGSEKFYSLLKKMQEPWQDLTKLNIKTFQGMTFVPEGITNIKKPEDLMATQIKLAVSNGRKALDYMQEYLSIMERTMCSFVEEAKETRAKGEKLREKMEK